MNGILEGMLDNMEKLFTIYWDLDEPITMAGKILDIARYSPNDIVVNVFRGIAQLRIKSDDGTYVFSIKRNNYHWHFNCEVGYER
jgi:hypothetical protein